MAFPWIMALQAVMQKRQAEAAEKEAKEQAMQQALLKSYAGGASKYGAPTESLQALSTIQATQPKGVDKGAWVSNMAMGLLGQNKPNQPNPPPTANGQPLEAPGSMPALSVASQQRAAELNALDWDYIKNRRY